MIRRISNSKVDSSQLGRPFGVAPPAGKPQVIEPISVRVLEAVRLTGIGRSKLYELISSGAMKLLVDWTIQMALLLDRRLLRRQLENMRSYPEKRLAPGLSRAPN